MSFFGTRELASILLYKTIVLKKQTKQLCFVQRPGICIKARQFIWVRRYEQLREHKSIQQQYGHY